MIPTFFALLVCAGGLFVSGKGTLYLVMVFSLFGGAAAIALPALGGATITPAVLFLPFLLARALRERGLDGCLRPLAFPNAGFWLMLVALWGVISAYFLPRIFAGEILILQSDRFAMGFGTSSVPTQLMPMLLQPVSTNLTQSGYALGGVCAFIAISALLSKREKLQHFRDAVLLLASLNCLAGLINLAEFHLGLPSVLDYVRTGGYRIFGQYEEHGMMRVAGTFPESSMFAIFTLPLFAFTLSLWVSNARPRYSGWITLASLFLLLISSSSTAYVALAIYMSCLGVLAMRALFRGNVPRQRSFILGWLALVAIGWVLVFEPDVTNGVSHFLDAAVFSKLDSHSGIERTAWNRQAWSNFLESYGIGVGLGSARASSFVLVLLSNVGIFGTILFLTFLARVFRGVPAGIAPYAETVAARHAVFAALIATTVSGMVFDLGVAFYAFAAAASIPSCEPATTRSESRGASVSVAAINRSSDISPPTPDLGLNELLRKLRRKKWLIFTFVAIATLLTAVGSLLLTSRYTAIAEVLVADHRATGLDLEAAMQGMPTTDVAHMSSQVRVIRSRKLASSVIDKLGLELDPEFNEALEPRSVVRRLIDELPIEDVKRMLGLARPALSDTAAKQLEREAVTDAFLKGVFAQTVETSRVIKIQFTSEDPAKAAMIANALADAYINQQRQVQDEAIRRTVSWLTDRVDALRKEVKDADQAVEKFRAARGLFQGTQGERLSDQQISELSSQLMVARSSLAESEARLSQLRNLARSDAMASLAEVVNSPLISTLITQEAEVKRKIAQLLQEYGSRHPVLINTKAELQDLRAKIDTEVKRIVQSLENEIAVASAREQSLQRSLDQFGVRLSKSNADEVTLRALERDTAAARSTLETFLQQAHQLNAQDTLRAQQPEVTLISYAPIPTETSFPKRTLMIALAVVVSGLLAVVLVLIIEQLDAGFRSSEQLEQAFDVPVLGLIPDLRHRRRNNKKQVARYVLEQPTSSFAEAIRRTHTKLLQERTIRTVQLTSAEPGEGKTTLALNLAQTNVRLGGRVLLVDADFRRSEVADILELRKSPGLIDVLSRRARFEDVVQTDKSGAHVLVAGDFEPFASEMLVLRNLAPLLSLLQEQYDLIIVDTQPVISLVDAAVVAGFVDRTILVVRWAGPRRSVVSHALNEIAAAGGTLGGVILSMVNVEEHALYSFGDSGQYHGRYKKYYDVA